MYTPYSSLFSQAIVWSNREWVNPSGFDGACRQSGHAHGSGYNMTALSALLYVRIGESKGSCREHSPASAHSAQYGSIGQLARASERAVAGHVQCPTARQGQGLEHRARTNTGMLMKSTLMFPTKILRKKTWREERLTAVVDGIRVDGIRRFSQLGHYVVLLWPSLACCSVAHAWSPCFPADCIHA
jgi:hypothetical protein